MRQPFGSGVQEPGAGFPCGVRAALTRAEELRTCHNYGFNDAFVGRLLNRSRYGASGTPSLTFRKP